MDEFSLITQASIPVFLMIVVGAAVRWAGWFPKNASDGTLKVVVNALIPCLIVDSVLGNQALKQPSNLLLAPMVGILTVLLGMVVGWLCSGLAGLRGREFLPHKRSFVVSVGFYNYAYLPFPLAMALYDQNTVGVLFVYNVGVEVCVWTVIVGFLSGCSLLKEWRKIFNMPLLAIIFALALNFMGLNTYMPTAIRATFHGLGQCAYPLGIMVTGAVIYDLCREENIFRKLRPTVVGTVLRCFLLPLVTLAIASCFSFSVEIRRVIVLQAAMPTAIFAMVLSELCKANSATALRIVICTTLLSVIGTPIWIRIGSRILGL